MTAKQNTKYTKRVVQESREIYGTDIQTHHQLLIPKLRDARPQSKRRAVTQTLRKTSLNTPK